MEPTASPLTQAITVEYASSSDDVTIYQGIVNGDWCIGAVPNGGFSLSLLLKACIQYQASTKHPDPINVTAHYLQAVQVAPFEVRVRTIKNGRGFSNVLADLMQKGTVRITAHSVFGVLEPLPDAPGPHLTLKAPSPYARRHPLHLHPSEAIPEPLRHTWRFHTLSRWAPDPMYKEQNAPGRPQRTDSQTIGGGGVKWAAWFELTNESEVINTPSLCFLADIFQKAPVLLPESEKVGLGTSWFPTMVLNIEFKFPIPKTSADHSTRTVGIYSSTHFMNDPQGRTNPYIEVWTAPCNIGEGQANKNWRETQFCLATSTQMALTVPMEVNQRQASRL
ncbi:hypothetical protein FIBSPDRAFT_818907 [Athelia psychrophila]|uniref:Acyl-CoA thioesterase-like N-terminal HotDog domain-containing protein n=1 Tax=Athelia psychrophila TaxID=1759441 RepID=A0A166QBP8_9AGAM|nr:hypothetical protein FIBSPDRAFT_818907 [Fibularhizoctonia sp. CBS 109695]